MDNNTAAAATLLINLNGTVRALLSDLAFAESDNIKLQNARNISGVAIPATPGTPDFNEITDELETLRSMTDLDPGQWRTVCDAAWLMCQTS